MNFQRHARPVLALLPPLLVWALQSALWDWIDPYAWLLFYPAVFVSIWIGGLRPGLLAAVLSAALVWWFFVPPALSLVKAPKHYFPACAFLGTGVLFAYFFARLQRAQQQATAALTAASHANEGLQRANQSLQRALDDRHLFFALVENSSDFIGVADPNGKPVYLNAAGRRMVDLPLDQRVEDTQIPDYYPAEQRSFVSNVIVKAMVERGRWKGETYFRNWQTGEPIPVSDEHFMIRDPETGRPLGMGTITRDVSDLKAIESKLRASLAEKEILLKEVHHRVKNNLQIMSSMLALQTRQQASAATRDTFKAAQARIQVMALIHEQLYQSGDLASIGFDEHVRRLSTLLVDTFRTEQRLHLECQLDPVQLSLDTAIPVGLIAGELITNAIKHAFRGRTEGTIWIRLTRHEDEVVLSVADDGLGLSPRAGMDSPSSLGLQLVKMLARQVKGQLILRDSQRTEFVLQIPLHEAVTPTLSYAPAAHSSQG